MVANVSHQQIYVNVRRAILDQIVKKVREKKSVLMQIEITISFDS